MHRQVFPGGINYDTQISGSFLEFFPGMSMRDRRRFFLKINSETKNLVTLSLNPRCGFQFGQEESVFTAALVVMKG